MNFIEYIDRKTVAYCLVKLAYPSVTLKLDVQVRVLKIYRAHDGDSWRWRHIVVKIAETPSSLARLEAKLGMSLGEREEFDEVGGRFDSWEEAEISLALAGWKPVEDISDFFSKDKIFLPLAVVEKAWMIEKRWEKRWEKS